MVFTFFPLPVFVVILMLQSTGNGWSRPVPFVQSRTVSGDQNMEAPGQ